MLLDAKGPAAASGDLAGAHAQSTQALKELLRQGAALVAGALSHQSAHRMGPLACEVRANDAALGRWLTHCLLPLAAGPESGRADLTLHVLCGSASPAQAPPPWNLPHTDARHLERLHLCPQGSLSAFYDHDRRFWLILDHAAGEALLWLADAQDVPFWEAAAPFKTLINWFLSEQPVSMLHGGVVVHAGRALMLVGPGGSGKSTTVAACFEAGLQVCGDDLVLAERAADGWHAHALYNALKLEPGGAIAIPARLLAAPWWPCGEKRLVRYSDVDPQGLALRAPLAGLMQCVITGGGSTRIVPQPAAALLRAIAPPTVFLLRGREASTLAKVASLVRTVPTYRLELGAEPAAAAAVLRTFLQAQADLA